MFCPSINAECVGQKCRDWDHKERACMILVERGEAKEFKSKFEQFVQAFNAVCESERFSNIWNRLAINQLLQDPSLTSEQKEVIRQALAAPSSEVAKKLLDDAGLLDSQ